MSNGNHPAEWTNRTFYSFDIESTSADPLTAHLVTATLVKFADGKPGEDLSWIVSPEIEIPAEATEIHGLTTEWAREHGMDPKKAINEIVAMVVRILRGGYPLVVFNAAYDLTMLEKQAEHFGVPGVREQVPETAWNNVVDPFVLVKGYEMYWKDEFVKGRTYKLPDVCARWGVDFEESHDAKADAIGAGLLTINLVNDHEVLYKKGPSTLARLHKNWRKRLQDGLRKYFDDHGIEHDGVDAGWPLHSSLMPAED